MSTDEEINFICEEIQNNYSPCDVSDALLTLKVPSAGHLRDITPLPNRLKPPTRIVAPISTVLFVDKTHTPGTTYPDILVPTDSNLPAGKHFSDHALPGSVVVMQQPSHHIAALVGDIVATRYQVRGIKGVVTDGRVRDVVGIGAVADFQCWNKSLSSVGTSLEAKPWAVDVPLQIGGVLVKPGDLLVADEGEMVCCVIPRERVREVMTVLPGLKEADDGLLGDVKEGKSFGEAIGRWPGHYTNRK